ncbi:MAG: hypothetical protein NTZ90_13175 [Proteobacteria bacterium]|nr:hypothetical protein [Pseudomonadota bacterium]
MIFATVAIGVLLLTALLMPFWLGRGGLLQASASVNSQAQLLALKDALLKAYLKDELAFTAGALPARSWHQRRDFLTNRYIDAARRLDFLARTQADGGGVP